VGVLDAFLSTWSTARETFGQGVPHTGERFDQSGTLRQLQTTVESAAPRSRWTGTAAAAYDAANQDHGKVFARLAALDQRLAAQVDASAQVVTSGRQDLDAVRKWVLDAANSVPAGKNREQLLMPIVAKGLGQLSQIVTKSNGDLAAIGGQIRTLGGEYQALGDQKFGADVQSAVGGTGEPSGTDEPRTPITPGRPADPSDRWVGDPNFGHWETVPLPPSGPYAPLKPEYRPFPDDTPLKVGPTTGMYVPGKPWLSDEDAPYVQYQEGYRFRIAGTQATDLTRVTSVDGKPQVQRWVANVYEYQRNTSTGGGNDLGGLPPIQNIDQTWKPISLPEIATLSADNPAMTYYLPDGCGGSVKFNGGVPADSAAPGVPTMTRPR
jgi:EspA/EspE family